MKGIVVPLAVVLAVGFCVQYLPAASLATERFAGDYRAIPKTSIARNGTKIASVKQYKDLHSLLVALPKDATMRSKYPGLRRGVKKPNWPSQREPEEIAMGPSSSPNPAYTLTPLLRHSRAPRRTPSHFVSRRSTNSLDAPRQPVLVYSLNQRITCMANANARSSTHGDIRGHFRRRSSIPTQPTGAANSLSNDHACHHSL